MIVFQSAMCKRKWERDRLGRCASRRMLLLEPDCFRGLLFDIFVCRRRRKESLTLPERGLSQPAAPTHATGLVTDTFGDYPCVRMFFDIFGERTRPCVLHSGPRRMLASLCAAASLLATFHVVAGISVYQRPSAVKKVIFAKQTHPENS
jgi:hypothetical protein